MSQRIGLSDIAAQLLRLTEPHPFNWVRDAIGFYNPYFYLYLAAFVLYLPVMFGSIRFMTYREAVKVPKVVLIVWNSFWSCFSGIVFWHLLATVPAMQTVGLRTSICTDQPVEISEDAMRARLLFIAANLPEMGDTAFLVLKKKKVDFLHYWHHLTVMGFCWQIVYLKHYDEGGDGTFFALMNSFIHWIMYAYYAATTLSNRYRVEAIARILTCGQIGQMVIGMAILVYRTMECSSVYLGNLAFGWLIYSTYFGLFVHYFVKRYILSKPTKVVKSKETRNGSNGASDGHSKNGKKEQ